MTVALIDNAPEEVTRWVEAQLGMRLSLVSAAIGVAIGPDPIAGVIYSHFTENPRDGTPCSVEMSIASVSPKWCTRRTLHQFFKYPFSDLGVGRVAVTIHRKNKNTRKLVERLGFVYEGKGRRAWPTGGDAVVYSMLPHECRWINNE